MFFPRETIILFQFAKKLEKRNGKMVLYFYFAFNRQAVHIENERWKSTSDIVEGQRNYKSKIKKKIRKKCPSMASYFAPSSYPELLVYTQTYLFTKLN